MFGKKPAEDNSVHAENEKKPKNKKVLVVFLIIGGFIVGMLAGKVYMQNELDKLTEKKNALVQGMDHIRELMNSDSEEFNKLQKQLIESLDKQKELGDAFENAISVQEAVGVINRKIEMVKSNAERLKRSYIDDNPEAKNLDYQVIKELLKVVDDDTTKQLTTLKQAIKVLIDYQKNKDLVIKRDSPKVSSQEKKPEAKIDNIDIQETIIEPIEPSVQLKEAQ